MQGTRARRPSVGPRDVLKALAEELHVLRDIAYSDSPAASRAAP
jgi:hypothetical protein